VSQAITSDLVFEWLRENVQGFADAGFESVQELEDALLMGEVHRFSYPVSAPPQRTRVIRDGHSVKVPKPTLVIDSREREGYRFDRLSKWIAGTVTNALPVGDYSVEEMEHEIAIERKSFSDAITSVMPPVRPRFLKACEKLSRLPRKAIVIEASLTDLKSGPYTVVQSHAHPNAVVGSYLAIQERWNIPVIFADSHELAEEWTAHVLTKYHLLRWLEDNGCGRWFVDGDI